MTQHLEKTIRHLMSGTERTSKDTPSTPDNGVTLTPELVEVLRIAREIQKEREAAALEKEEVLRIAREIQKEEEEAAAKAAGKTPEPDKTP